jgi:hypothetical protein
MRKVLAAVQCAVLALGIAAAVVGCGSAPLALPSDSSSPTGGIGLRLWYAQVPTRQYQYFKLSDDGTLEFGGGLTAFNHKTDWTGKLTAEQGKAVRTLIDQSGWLTIPKPGRTEGETPVAELRVEAEGGYREFTIAGPDPKVEELLLILQTAANKRFDAFLERLPEPGPQNR